MVETMAGTGRLIRLILRRERIRLSVWIAVLALVPVSTANAFIGLYPTEESRVALAATVVSNPAFTALLGPLHNPRIGALTAWRFGTIGAVLVGVMAILTVVRHTREEEETGRRELLGSTVVGRSAPLAATLIVIAGAGLLLGLLIAAGLIGVGLETSGSIAFGLGFAGLTFTFASVGALAAQLSQFSSTARGIGMGIVGLAVLGFLLRTVGGESTAWLVWLSPIGWFTELRPFAGEEWWILGLWLGFGVVMISVAVVLAARRDVGAGAFPPRPGPSTAGASLSNPLGLAWRLHRGSVLGWTVGLALLGAVYGAAADGIGDMLEGNPALLEIFEQLGGGRGLVDTFFSAAVGIIALIASAYAVGAVLRLDVEEDRVRAEPVLATATPRSRFAWSHLIFGIVGPVLILAVAGAVAGATYGMIVGDIAGWVPRVVGSALAQLPAVWVLTGATMALYGLAPQYTGLSWGVLVWCLLLGQLGQILQFPQWSLNLSPFSHIPLIPAEDVEVFPILVLLVIAAALIGAGLVGFRRRDIG